LDVVYYFGEVFTPMAFMLLVGGTIGGLILRATPGLSPTMAVALLNPFTFRLEPAHGLILLGAAYTSTVVGGPVSAILLKIPGAPANIATTLDGHTMAMQGRGPKALQLSFLSSADGGIFGVLLLIFLTPMLAKWALAFGPSHLFWLAILGVTVIGTSDTNSVVKGLLFGCMGMWLATIGTDDIMGAQRFIVHPSLAGGISIVPALIGLFAIPQVLALFARGRQPVGSDVITVQKHSIGRAMREMIRCWRALSINSFEPIANWGADPAVFFVGADSEFNSMQDVVAWAKENPGKLTLSGSGAGLFVGHHIAALQLEAAADVNLAYIPNNSGGAGAMKAVIAGEVMGGVNNLSDAYRAANAGSVKILGVFDTERSTFLPDVPTLQEVGYDIDNLSVNYRGIMVPKGTPQEAIDKLAAVMPAMFADPNVAKQMEAGGSPMKVMTRDEVIEMWAARQKTLEKLLAGL
jgi:tripartite-type tricarboxylate transporter receptor subunit TctC